RVLFRSGGMPLGSRLPDETKQAVPLSIRFPRTDCSTAFSTHCFVRGSFGQLIRSGSKNGTRGRVRCGRPLGGNSRETTSAFVISANQQRISCRLEKRECNEATTAEQTHARTRQ